MGLIDSAMKSGGLGYGYQDPSIEYGKKRKEPDGGDFSRGLSRGIDQTQALGYAGLAITGGFLRTIGLDNMGSGLEQFGIEGYESNMLEAAENAPSVRWKDVAGSGFTLEGASQFMDWAQGVLGEQLPNMAMMLGSGGLGAVIGRRVLSKAALKKIAKNKLEGKAAEELLKTATTKGIKYGSGAGAFAASEVLNAGEIYGSILEETGEMAPAEALLFGTLAASLDVLAPVQVLRRLGKGEAFLDYMAGKIPASKLYQRSLAGAVTTMITEGSTEGMQAVIEAMAVNYVKDAPLFELNEAQKDEVIESIAAGALMGKVMGAVTPVVAKKGEPKDKKPSKDEVKDVINRVSVEELFERYLNNSTLGALITAESAIPSVDKATLQERISALESQLQYAEGKPYDRIRGQIEGLKKDMAEREITFADFDAAGFPDAIQTTQKAKETDAQKATGERSLFKNLEQILNDPNELSPQNRELRKPVDDVLAGLQRQVVEGGIESLTQEETVTEPQWQEDPVIPWDFNMYSEQDRNKISAFAFGQEFRKQWDAFKLSKQDKVMTKNMTEEQLEAYKAERVEKKTLAALNKRMENATNPPDSFLLPPGMTEAQMSPELFTAIREGKFDYETGEIIREPAKEGTIDFDTKPTDEGALPYDGQRGTKKENKIERKANLSRQRELKKGRPVGQESVTLNQEGEPTEVLSVVDIGRLDPNTGRMTDLRDIPGATEASPDTIKKINAERKKVLDSEKRKTQKELKNESLDPKERKRLEKRLRTLNEQLVRVGGKDEILNRLDEIAEQARPSIEEDKAVQDAYEQTLRDIIRPIKEIVSKYTDSELSNMTPEQLMRLTGHVEVIREMITATPHGPAIYKDGKNILPNKPRTVNLGQSRTEVTQWVPPTEADAVIVGANQDRYSILSDRYARAYGWMFTDEPTGQGGKPVLTSSRDPVRGQVKESYTIHTPFGKKHPELFSGKTLDPKYSMVDHGDGTFSIIDENNKVMARDNIWNFKRYENFDVYENRFYVIRREHAKYVDENGKLLNYKSSSKRKAEDMTAWVVYRKYGNKEVEVDRLAPLPPAEWNFLSQRGLFVGKGDSAVDDFFNRSISPMNKKGEWKTDEDYAEDVAQARIRDRWHEPLFTLLEQYSDVRGDTIPPNATPEYRKSKRHKRNDIINTMYNSVDKIMYSWANRDIIDESRKDFYPDEEPTDSLGRVRWPDDVWTIGPRQARELLDYANEILKGMELNQGAVWQKTGEFVEDGKTKSVVTKIGGGQRIRDAGKWTIIGPARKGPHDSIMDIHRPYDNEIIYDEEMFTLSDIRMGEMDDASESLDSKVYEQPHNIVPKAGDKVRMVRALPNDQVFVSDPVTVSSVTPAKGGWYRVEGTLDYMTGGKNFTHRTGEKVFFVFHPRKGTIRARKVTEVEIVPEKVTESKDEFITLMMTDEDYFNEVAFSEGVMYTEEGMVPSGKPRYGYTREEFEAELPRIVAKIVGEERVAKVADKAESVKGRAAELLELLKTEEEEIQDRINDLQDFINNAEELGATPEQISETKSEINELNKRIASAQGEYRRKLTHQSARMKGQTITKKKVDWSQLHNLPENERKLMEYYMIRNNMFPKNYNVDGYVDYGMVARPELPTKDAEVVKVDESRKLGKASAKELVELSDQEKQEIVKQIDALEKELRPVQREIEQDDEDGKLSKEERKALEAERGRITKRITALDMRLGRTLAADEGNVVIDKVSEQDEFERYEIEHKSWESRLRSLEARLKVADENLKKARGKEKKQEARTVFSRLSELIRDTKREEPVKPSKKKKPTSDRDKEINRLKRSVRTMQEVEGSPQVTQEQVARPLTKVRIRPSAIEFYPNLFLSQIYRVEASNKKSVTLTDGTVVDLEHIALAKMTERSEVSEADTVPLTLDQNMVVNGYGMVFINDGYRTHIYKLKKPDSIAELRDATTNPNSLPDDIETLDQLAVHMRQLAIYTQESVMAQLDGATYIGHSTSDAATTAKRFNNADMYGLEIFDKQSTWAATNPRGTQKQIAALEEEINHDALVLQQKQEQLEEAESFLESEWKEKIDVLAELERKVEEAKEGEGDVSLEDAQAAFDAEFDRLVRQKKKGLNKTFLNKALDGRKAIYVLPQVINNRKKKLSEMKGVAERLGKRVRDTQESPDFFVRAAAVAIRKMTKDFMLNTGNVADITHKGKKYAGSIVKVGRGDRGLRVVQIKDTTGKKTDVPIGEIEGYVITEKVKRGKPRVAAKAFTAQQAIARGVAERAREQDNRNRFIGKTIAEGRPEIVGKTQKKYYEDLENERLNRYPNTPQVIMDGQGNIFYGTPFKMDHPSDGDRIFYVGEFVAGRTPKTNALSFTAKTVDALNAANKLEFRRDKKKGKQTWVFDDNEITIIDEPYNEEDFIVRKEPDNRTAMDKARALKRRVREQSPDVSAKQVPTGLVGMSRKGAVVDTPAQEGGSLGFVTWGNEVIRSPAEGALTPKAREVENTSAGVAKKLDPVTGEVIGTINSQAGRKSRTLTRVDNNENDGEVETAPVEETTLNEVESDVVTPEEDDGVIEFTTPVSEERAETRDTSLDEVADDDKPVDEIVDSMAKEKALVVATNKYHKVLKERLKRIQLAQRQSKKDKNFDIDDFLVELDEWLSNEVDKIVDQSEGLVTIDEVINTASQDSNVAMVDAEGKKGISTQQARDITVSTVGKKLTDALVVFVGDPKNIPGRPTTGDNRVVRARVLGGKIYIAENVVDANEMRGLIYHELGVHVGLRKGMTPTERHMILSRFRALRRNDPEVRSAYAEAQLTGTKHLDEEALAIYVERFPPTGLPRGIWRTLIDVGRKILKAFRIIKGEPTARDLVRVIQGAVRNVEDVLERGIEDVNHWIITETPLDSNVAAENEMGPEYTTASKIDRGWLMNWWNDTMGDKFKWYGMENVEQYMALHQNMNGNLAQVDRIAREISGALNTDDPVVKRQAFDFITTANANPNMITDPEIRKAAVNAKNAIQNIGQELVDRKLLSKEAFNKLKGAYLPRMYMKFVMDNSRKGRRVSTGMKLGPMDYTKKRMELSEEEREAFYNEIKDASFLTMQAISRPLRDIAMFDMLEQISKNDDWVLPKQTVMWNDKKVPLFWLANESAQLRERLPYLPTDQRDKASDLADKMDAAVNARKKEIGLDKNIPDGYIELPKGKAYGNLAGMVVRKRVYDDVAGIFNLFIGDESFAERLLQDGGWMTTANMLWKWAHVVINPATIIRNFGSNAILMYLSGMPWVDVVGYLNKSFNAVWEQSFGKGSEIGAKYERYGVSKGTYANVELMQTNSEFKAMLKRAALENGEGGLRNKLRIYALTAQQYGGKAHEVSGNFYQFLEEWAKVAKAMYEEEVNGHSTVDAVNLAHHWLIDYSDVPRSVRYLRSAPIGIPFLTFTYKVIPLMLEAATTNPQRFVGFIAAYYAMAELTKAMLDLDDDEYEKYLNRAPESTEGGAVLIPVTDDDGNPYILDMKRFMPWQPLQDFAMSIAKGNPIDAAKGLGIGSGMLPGMIAGLATNTDSFTGRPIVDEGVGAGRQAAQAAVWGWNLMMPPFMTSNGFIVKGYKAATGATNRYGEPESDALRTIGSATGFNLYPASEGRAESNLNFLGFELRQLQEAKRRALRGLRGDERRDEQSYFDELIKKKSDEIKEYKSKVF